MSRVGYTPSQLSTAMERAQEAVELRERLEFAAPMTLVPFKLEVGEAECVRERTYYVNRQRLLELAIQQEKELVERAHRLMHGVTGD